MTIFMQAPVWAAGRAPSTSQNVPDDILPRLPAHVHRLSSAGNDFVKHVVKLRQSSSYRAACGSIVVVGDVPLRELCEIAPSKFGNEKFLQFLFVLDGSNEAKEFAPVAKRIVHVSPTVMRKLSGVESANGLNLVGIVPFPASFTLIQGPDGTQLDLPSWCLNPQRLLVLDGIQDPGNLGTLLRTAAAFNWDGVFLMNGCCDPFNGKALRASRGACFWIPVACGYWSHLQPLIASKKVRFYAGEPEHKTSTINHISLHQDDQNKDQAMRRHSLPLDIVPREEPIGLILGSEGSGLCDDVRDSCTLISIPMPGKFESLNVAVAGGIMLYMLQQQICKTS